MLWPGECGAFTRESVDSLYAWAYHLGASGIRLQTDRPIIIQLHGRVRRVTRRSLSGLEVEEAVNRLYGADGQARLKSGEDFDVSYEIQPDRRTRLRFRVNATAVLSRGNDGAAVTARPLPNVVPHLADLGIEAEIRECFRPRDGFVIVSGGTGNGKSTTLAAMQRETIEDPDSHAAILEYAAPIEFVYDDIHGPTATIEQSEIPRHLPSFAAGIRNAMRREPNVIVVGECRDGETMGAATNAALTAHAVYTTIHAGSVAESMQRIVSLCPPEERASLTVAIAQTMRLIVNQRLVSSTDYSATIWMRRQRQSGWQCAVAVLR
jgi:defect in organelle trafficking protein DotB